MNDVDHNKLIRDAARRELLPLGMIQKGRSRTWLDDHGWWLVVVEFQPSGFGRGSYLNAGTMHLWRPEQDDFVFEGSARVVTTSGRQFVEAGRDPVRAASAFDSLAKEAARRVLELRRDHGTGRDALERLAATDPEDHGDVVWGLFNIAVASGLTGDRRAATERFDQILTITSESDADWERHLDADIAQRWKPALESFREFEAVVADCVERTRSLLRLPALDTITFR